jgi:hypothetical protein
MSNTAFKERPILFSTDMVQAIMDCSKTQTRRLVKNFEINENIQGNYNFVSASGKYSAGINCTTEDLNTSFMGIVEYSPYGKKGDLLWVREAWRPIGWDGERFGVKVEFKDGATICEHLFDNPDKDLDFEMKCSDIMHDKDVDYDTETPNGSEAWSGELIRKHMPWKPSIHMPKAAARIWLLVEDVQVQRLQDISEEDAKSEGVQSCVATKELFGARAQGLRLYRNYDRSDHSLKDHPCNGFDTAKVSFETLWESINGKDSWNENPWVWVVKFKVLSTDGKPENLDELVGMNRMKSAFDAKGHSRTTEKA